MDKHNITDEMLAEALIGNIVDFTKHVWSSNWIGYEVGFDDVESVGLYTFPDSKILYYVNIQNGCVLDAWVNEY